MDKGNPDILSGIVGKINGKVLPVSLRDIGSSRLNRLFAFFKGVDLAVFRIIPVIQAGSPLSQQTAPPRLKRILYPSPTWKEGLYSPVKIFLS